MLVDAHCHLSCNCSATDHQLHSDHVRCVMSTNHSDWQKLKKMKVEGLIKCFGIHPWYSHLFTLEQNVNKISHYLEVLDWKNQDRDELDTLVEVLPDPINIDTYIEAEFDSQLVTVIGEIGLDRSFRLPKNTGYYTDNCTKPLSRIKVKMSHQIAIFMKFCGLARKNGKPVSIHGVKCHGVLYEICQRELMPYHVHICLHSVTASLHTLQMWIREYGDLVFFSLSQWINFKNVDEGRALVRTLPLKCILTETDLPLDEFDDAELTDQLNNICSQINYGLNLDGFIDIRQSIYMNFCRFIKQKS